MAISRPITPDEVANTSTSNVRPSLVLDDVLPKAQSPFFSLPREIQLFIFSFLPHKELCKTVANVCQHWWTLSKDPSLWKSLDITVRREDETLNLALLLLRSPTLTKLKISTEFYLEEFAVFAYACPMLKHLDLNSCKNVDHRILALFVKYCPLIEVVNVSYCKVDKQSVSSIIGLQHLRVLYLAGCPLDDDIIQLLSEKCRNLEYLDLAFVAGITDEPICGLAENLHATLLGLEVSAIALTDSAFLRLSLCRRLQHLHVNEGENITDKTLLYLKMLTDLKSLTLVGTGKLSAVAMNNFFAGPNVHNIVKLDLSCGDIDDDGVYNITQNCKLLKVLKLSSCYEVTEVGLEHIVKYCKNLIELELVYVNQVTGLCLKSIPENLSCLVRLSVECCDEFDESILDDIVLRVPKLIIT